MKERPIIFTELIPKILDGTKTQTRRVIKPQPTKPEGTAHDWEWPPAGMLCYDDYFREHAIDYCPYGQVGDRLWVRETWFNNSFLPQDKENVLYRVDGEFKEQIPEDYIGANWESPLFMPRWASRITLEITGIRVERLQEISRSDAMAEGVIFMGGISDDLNGGPWCASLEHQLPWASPIDAFANLWDSLNAKRKIDITTNLDTVYPYSWRANPWVWVLSFKKL